jgi:hypothetical protein
MVQGGEGFFLLRGEQGKAVRLADVALHQVEIAGNRQGILGLFNVLHDLGFQNIRQLFGKIGHLPVKLIFQVHPSWSGSGLYQMRRTGMWRWAR